MIASLTGRVAQVGLDHAVINVNGFGMLVYATARTLSKLRTGEEATVLTTMIVREESMTLYGFSEPAEREVFDMMLSVSGIGPRIALAVLSVHTASEVERAVATGDDKAFTKVPGIGPKGARRIVLELAGKLILSDGQTDELPLSQGIVWSRRCLMLSPPWAGARRTLPPLLTLMCSTTLPQRPSRWVWLCAVCSPPWVLRTRWAATKRCALFDVSHSNFCERRIL